MQFSLKHKTELLGFDPLHTCQGCVQSAFLMKLDCYIWGGGVCGGRGGVQDISRKLVITSRTFHNLTSNLVMYFNQYELLASETFILIQNGSVCMFRSFPLLTINTLLE